MNGSVVVKQADVVLIAFPLGYNDNYTDQDGLNDLDYVGIILIMTLVVIADTRTVCEQAISRWTSHDLGNILHRC